MSSNLIIVVGLVDDVKSTEGIIEIFDVKAGRSIARKSEEARLCSVVSVPLIGGGDNIEMVFIGTSKFYFNITLFRREED